MAAVTLSEAFRAADIAARHLRAGDQRVPCPLCNKGLRDDALGVTIFPDGSALWHCYRCDWRGAWRPWEQREERPRHRAAMQPRQQARATVRPKDWSAEAEAIVAQTEPDHELLRRYFGARGVASIATPSLALRFLRSGVGAAGTLPEWPRQVGIIVDAVTGRRISLHFTALAGDGAGKAPIERPKRLLAGHRKAGGVIRLSPGDQVELGLGISEGIETGLAVLAAGWSPVWAAIDAGNITAFPMLPGVESLSIFADNDAAGLKAAAACQSRWRAAGREARIVHPRSGGSDWADLARGAA